MADRRARSRQPHRFRRRLTAAFVLVAAVSAGLVAAVTFLLAREYRWRNFRSTAAREARVALAVAPQTLDAAGFDRLRAAYDPQSEADIVAVGPKGVFSSSPSLGPSDIPPALRNLPSAEQATSVEADVGERRSLVIGSTGRGDSRYYFFFSLEQLEESLDELARVALAAWAVTVAAAGAVGQVMSRRTLRPVAEVASVAGAIASGDLGARLPVASDDEFGVLAGSFNNMADEVQTLVAELEEAARRQRRFTADVAHELRTPLTGMSATASVLAELMEEVPPSARRAAEVLVADVRRLRELVLELLELARLDAKTETLQLEPLRVRDAVEAVVRTTHAHGGAVEIDVRDEVVVSAEPVRLRRILANLLENAVVHGGGRVTVTARTSGPEVVLEVADKGDGILPEDLPRVFDRFFKSDRSRSHGGSGLGLAIARQHAVAQGGELSVRNDAGGGARFTLRLRAAVPLAGHAPPQAEVTGTEGGREVERGDGSGRTPADPLPRATSGR